MAEDREPAAGAPLGRPPMAEGKARTRRTVTFLTEDEYQQLADIARRNDMSISSTAHKLLVLALNSWH